MKIKDESILKLVFFLIWLGSISYSLIYYLGFYQKGESLAKVIHLAINFGILIPLGFAFVNHNKIAKEKTVNLFMLTIIGMAISTFLQLRIQEVIPGFLRFVNYYLFFSFSYHLYKKNRLNDINKGLNFFLILSVFSCLFFGFYEILIGDVQFLNGAYRVSGSFKFHQLAFGMYLFCIIAILLMFKVNNGNISNREKLWSLIAMFLLVFLFGKVHSRMLSVSFFVSIFLVLFLRYKSVFIRFKLLFTGFAFSVIMIILIFNFGVQPRIKEFLMSAERENIDSSSQTRIDIISNTINNVDFIEFFSGIGFGRFNNFYEKITGEIGVAAHNNFLLFGTEGGFLMLIIYCLFLFVILLKLWRGLINRKGSSLEINFLALSLILFLGIEVLGFLLNNYYFYQSELLVWFFMGLGLSIRKYA